MTITQMTAGHDLTCYLFRKDRVLYFLYLVCPGQYGATLPLSDGAEQTKTTTGVFHRPLHRWRGSRLYLVQIRLWLCRWVHNDKVKCIAINSASNEVPYLTSLV